MRIKEFLYLVKFTYFKMNYKLFLEKRKIINSQKLFISQKKKNHTQTLK